MKNIKELFKRDKMKHPKAGMVEKLNAGEWIFTLIIYLLIIIASFIFIIPLWHVLMSSFSTGQLLIGHTGIVWWPVNNVWNFGGYEMLFQYKGVLIGYGNTILYVVAGTGLGLVINVIGGYCMCRKSMLQKFFVIYIMITMLFNGGMLPTFMVMRSLGLTGADGSYLPVIFLTSTNALYVVMTMNAFRGVNQATVEAAEIDGAGHLRIMFQVMLPQCVSMMSVVILFTVVGIWNSWFEASIYLPYADSKWPLQLWIKQIVADNGGFLQETNPDWNKYILTYTTIVAATLPILVIATVFQKYIEKGVILGGVKE